MAGSWKRQIQVEVVVEASYLKVAEGVLDVEHEVLAELAFLVDDLLL